MTATAESGRDAQRLRTVLWVVALATVGVAVLCIVAVDGLNTTLVDFMAT